MRGGTSLAEQEGSTSGSLASSGIAGSVWVPLGAASGSRLMPSSLHKGARKRFQESHTLCELKGHLGGKEKDQCASEWWQGGQVRNTQK